MFSMKLVRQGRIIVEISAILRGVLLEQKQVWTGSLNSNLLFIYLFIYLFMSVCLFVCLSVFIS